MPPEPHSQLVIPESSGPSSSTPTSKSKSIHIPFFLTSCPFLFLTSRLDTVLRHQYRNVGTAVWDASDQTKHFCPVRLHTNTQSQRSSKPHRSHLAWWTRIARNIPSNLQSRTTRSGTTRWNVSDGRADPIILLWGTREGWRVDLSSIKRLKKG